MKSQATPPITLVMGGDAHPWVAIPIGLDSAPYVTLTGSLITGAPKTRVELCRNPGTHGGPPVGACVPACQAVNDQPLAQHVIGMRGHVLGAGHVQTSTSQKLERGAEAHLITVSSSGSPLHTQVYTYVISPPTNIDIM